MTLRQRPEHGLGYDVPGAAPRINQIEVAGSWDLDQVYVFSFPLRSLLFQANVISAEGRRDILILRTVKQPLARTPGRQWYRIGLAIVIGYFRGCAMQKLDHGVVAEVELIGAVKVQHSGQGDYGPDVGLVRRQTQRQLASGRVSHQRDFPSIEVILLRILK